MTISLIISLACVLVLLAAVWHLFSAQERLRSRLDEENAKRAAFEERAGRTARLEAEIEGQKARFDALSAENNALSNELSSVTARLEEERKGAEEKLAVLDSAQARLSDAFKALSAEALKSNNESFLALAKSTLEKFNEQAKGDLEVRKQAIDGLVKPLADSLKTVGDRIQDLEKARSAAYAGITEQMKSMATTQSQLQGETANLVKALRKPDVRGRWGEIQLHRVVEIAGMLSHCDFVEQETTSTEKGNLRPDMIVRLPGKKTIVVDSKAPLAAYLDSLEAQDDEKRTALLADHARQIRTHLIKLGDKSYFEHLESTPEFVVLFLPGESFFSAALSADPSLIEFGVDQRVILATPTTLIALLKTVAYGWRQEQIAANATEISRLGRDLYERVRTVVEHLARLRKNLDGSVDAYNDLVGSMEKRFLPQARRFKELGACTGAEIETAEIVDKTTRAVQADELSCGPDGDNDKPRQRGV
jgi:DNA recombination protein RmuC